MRVTTKVVFSSHVRFEVFMAMLPPSSPEDGDNMHLQNVGILLQHYSITNQIYLLGRQ